MRNIQLVSQVGQKTTDRAYDGRLIVNTTGRDHFCVSLLDSKFGTCFTVVFEFFICYIILHVFQPEWRTHD